MLTPWSLVYEVSTASDGLPPCVLNIGRLFEGTREECVPKTFLKVRPAASHSLPISGDPTRLLSGLAQ